MIRIYYAQTVDYDDFPIGSPGTFYLKVEDAEREAEKRGISTRITVQSKLAFASPGEYKAYLNGDLLPVPDARYRR